MDEAVTLQNGGTIALARFDGERAEGVADRPLPPGSRHEGVLEGLTVRLKVERCRAATAGGFEVRVRLIDPSRELRERLRGQDGA